MNPLLNQGQEKLKGLLSHSTAPTMHPMQFPPSPLYETAVISHGIANEWHYSECFGICKAKIHLMKGISEIMVKRHIQ